ncbi:MAG: amidohydrolase family protein [Streptosporangiales bacterium]|nr:amidohydrolase family protein [Streptosporangiales bacterium]
MGGDHPSDMRGDPSRQDTPAERALTRRRFVLTGAAAGAAVPLAGGLGGTAAAAGPPSTTGRGRSGSDGEPDLILLNGKIHTMDPDNTVVRVVSIKNGRFARVGGGAPTPGSGTRVIDLRGRTVVPGIIDSHNHIVLLGNRPGFHTPLENAFSVADVQETYATRATAVPERGWITTIGGFHQNQLFPPDQTPRLPTLDELDEAVPKNPAYISQGFAGPSTTNSLGKSFFESRGIPVADDGSIAAGPEATGRATLTLRETLLTFEERKRGAGEAMAFGLGLGVTTHLDQGAFQATGTPSDGAAHEDNFTMHLPFLAVHREGNLNARLQINFLHMDASTDVPTLTERLKNAFPFFGDDMLGTGGIGEFLAEGLGDTWSEAARRVAEAGWRGEVHSLTGTDFQTEIAGFEAVNREFPIADLRWVVAHVPFITEDWLDRLKALGGGVNLTSWRYFAGTAQNNGPPFRMIVDNGINAGMGGDGMQIAPMNPWIQIYYATTGRNARGEVINDGQQITRHEALRLYTASNGWFLRREDDLGTIEPGKLADLVVLNKDYFAVLDEDLRRNLRSVLTVVGGRIVHDAGMLD